MPHFVYKGKNIAGMAPFKAHCAVMVHGDGRQETDGMGSYGKLTKLEDLPSDDQLKAKLRRAMDTIDRGEQPAWRKAPRKEKPPIVVPRDLEAALRDNDAARAAFAGFPPFQQREYVDWISDAKQDATRAKRLATSIEWLAEGKRRNWKYGH